MAGNIHALLKQHDAPFLNNTTKYGLPADVPPKQLWELIAEADDTVQQRMQNVSGATGRDIETNTFEDENAVRQFFTGAGFTIEEYPYQKFSKICLR